MLSWRGVVLAGVIVLALALLLPSLRVYFQQQQNLRELRAEVEQARAEVEDLEGEVARWEDPAFIVAQARERLAYVFPGEVPYRVIDPEFVTSHAAGSPAAERSPEALAGTPWFETMWGTFVAAGDGDYASADAEGADDEGAVSGPLTDVDFGG